MTNIRIYWNVKFEKPSQDGTPCIAVQLYTSTTLDPSPDRGELMGTEYVFIYTQHRRSPNTRELEEDQVRAEIKEQKEKLKTKLRLFLTQQERLEHLCRQESYEEELEV